MPQEQFFDCI